MDSFWTPSTEILSAALLVSLVSLIALPIFVRWIDEQLGYLMLFIGGSLLWLSLHLTIVKFDGSSFMQMMFDGKPEHLDELLLQSWGLLLTYFLLSLGAAIFRPFITRSIWRVSRRTSAPTLVFLWTLIAGSLGSLSVVTMGVVGAIFFGTLGQLTKRDYTPCVILYAATIGISALLTSVGEPLSLFITHSLGENSLYLLRTFGGVCLINVLALATGNYFLAKRAARLEETAEERMMKDVHRAERKIAREGGNGELQDVVVDVEVFEAETHNFSHTLDRILHSSSKLYFFIIGLLFFGIGIRPIAEMIFTRIPLPVAFFWNAISTVADNALLGILEIHSGMPQLTVLVLGISLAFWGVGLVPGNICNVILKENLSISFRRWAAIGMPCAVALAALNFTLIASGIAERLIFTNALHASLFIVCTIAVGIFSISIPAIAAFVRKQHKAGATVTGNILDAVQLPVTSPIPELVSSDSSRQKQSEAQTELVGVGK